MKGNFLSLFAVFACMAVVDAGAATRSSVYSNIDMRNSDGDTIRINRGVANTYSDDYGYRSTASRSGIYDDLGQPRVQHRVVPASSENVRASKRTYSKGETYKISAKRKYFIANPFYQPLKGQFGSVTTGEYMKGTYKFGNAGDTIDRKLTEWSIKEDLSYGLTDRISLQAMAKYNFDKLIWENSFGDSDSYKSNELNVYGFGIQGRIVDTNDWISTLSGYYEHQKHGVDYFIADLKAGYKVSTSTIYGLVRGWAINMDGDIYGDYMQDATTWGMLVYGDAKDTLFMGELGLGVWSVLAEDWTLNIEGLYGLYDWHNQLSVKGAFGWQPNDWFALNLYAKTSLYDSADSKHFVVYEGYLPVTAPSTIADVELSNFREWSVGLQVMFQF